ncbi:MAG: endonuclease V [Thermoanaerobaculum sp.]
MPWWVGQPRVFLRAVARSVVEAPLPFAPRWVAAADVAYGEKLAAAAVVLWDTEGDRAVWEASFVAPVPFAYRPGLFSLREAPLVLPLLARVPGDEWVALVHGHGRAHPLGAGLASVVGVILARPTVGCAGSLLCGQALPPARPRGSQSPVRLRGKLVGALVRTREAVKPVVVSVGNAVTLEEAVALVLATSSFRFPEPLRLADQLARRALRCVEP